MLPMLSVLPVLSLPVLSSRCIVSAATQPAQKSPVTTPSLFTLFKSSAPSSVVSAANVIPSIVVDPTAVNCWEEEQEHGGDFEVEAEEGDETDETDENEDSSDDDGEEAENEMLASGPMAILTSAEREVDNYLSDCSAGGASDTYDVEDDFLDDRSGSDLSVYGDSADDDDVINPVFAANRRPARRKCRSIFRVMSQGEGNSSLMEEEESEEHEKEKEDDLNPAPKKKRRTKQRIGSRLFKRQ